MNLGQAFVTLSTDMKPLESGLGQAKQKVGAAVGGMKDDFRSLEGPIQRLHETLVNAFKFVVVYEGMHEALSGIRKLIDAGMEFNKTLETAKISLTSSFLQNLSFGDSFHHAYEGAQKLHAALALTDQTVQRLRYDNLQTTATFQQLLEAYEGALPAGLKLGMTPQMVEQSTLRMLQAAGAMGWPMPQMGAEMRELLRGQVRTTSPLSSIFSLEEIKKARNNAQALFDLIMRNTSAFAETGKMTQNSFQGIWSNLKSMFSEAAGKGLADSLFGPLKDQMLQWQRMIFSVNDATHSISFSPEFVHDFHEIGQLAMDFVKALSAAAPPLLSLVSETAALMHNLGQAANYVHELSKGRAGGFLDNPNVQGYAAMLAGAKSGSQADIKAAIEHDQASAAAYREKIKNEQGLLGGWMPDPRRWIDQHALNAVESNLRTLQGLVTPETAKPAAAAESKLPFSYWAAQKPEEAAAKHPGGGHAKVFGADQAKYASQAAENDFTRLQQALKDQQDQLAIAQAKSAGDIFRADQLEAAKKLHDELSRIADQSDKAKTAIMRLQSQLSAKHPTPEAASILQTEIDKQKQLLGIDTQRAEIARKIYDLHVADAEKTHTLSGQQALAQLGVEQANISGTHQGQLQAQLALLKVEDLQKLASVDRSVPGLYSATQQVTSAEENRANVRANGSIAQNFFQEWDDQMRQTGSNAQIAEQALQALNNSIDMTSRTLWDLIANINHVDDHSRTLSNSLRNLGTSILSQFGNMLTKQFLTNYVMNPAMGLFEKLIPGLGGGSHSTATMNVEAAVVNIGGGLPGLGGPTGGLLGGLLSKAGGLIGSGITNLMGMFPSLAGALAPTYYLGSDWAANAAASGMAAFASGGVTSGPSLAGEAGPEAVVPLPGGRSIPVNLKGGSKGITSNITVNVSHNGENAQQAKQQGQEIARAIRAEIQGQLYDQMRPGGILNPNLSRSQ